VKDVSMNGLREIKKYQLYAPNARVPTGINLERKNKKW